MVHLEDALFLTAVFLGTCKKANCYQFGSEINIKYPLALASTGAEAKLKGLLELSADERANMSYLQMAMECLVLASGHFYDALFEYRIIVGVIGQFCHDVIDCRDSSQ